MKNEKKKISIGLLAVTGVVVLSLVMLTGRVQTSVAALGPAEDKQGYCQFFEIPGDTNEVIFTVPADERFVLLKLIACSTDFDFPRYSTQWSLLVDDTLFIDGRINLAGGEQWESEEIYSYEHDFPDKCVVVNSGETLKAHNSQPYQRLLVTIIGYFSTVQ